MSILGSIGAIGQAIGSAAKLVNEVRRPQLDKNQFAQILQQQVAAKQSASLARQDMRVQGALWTQNFLAARDADKDGVLSMEEAGFLEEDFARYDLNGDDNLSVQELQYPFLEALMKNQLGGAAGE